VASWVSSLDSIPQTEADLVDCVSNIRYRGIMGATGVAECTLTQFYNFNTANMLCEVSANVLDDIYETVDHYISQTNYNDPYDPTNLNQVCELYVNFYMDRYFEDTIEFVRSYAETILEDIQDTQEQ
jgi:hypothetical protein